VHRQETIDTTVPLPDGAMQFSVYNRHKFVKNLVFNILNTIVTNTLKIQILGKRSISFKLRSVYYCMNKL